MNLITTKFFIFLLIIYKSQCIPIVPSFSGASDQVISVPGLNTTLSFNHFSGYLNATNETFLFYWFFESQSNPLKDPIILWLNGGPGASSLYGALLETGPFQMKPNGTLALNPHSWNTNASLLFIESPAGVGFSYKFNVSADFNYATNDNETAILNFKALRSFYQKFPHFKLKNFYLTGQSYAGVYHATLAMLILKHKFPVNFKAVSLGNPVLDQRYTTHTPIEFAYTHGILNESFWSSLLKDCNCLTNSKSIRNCSLLNHTVQNFAEMKPKCFSSYKKAHYLIDKNDRNLYNYKQSCSNRNRNYICPTERDEALKVWLNQLNVHEKLHVSELKPNSTEWFFYNIKVLQNYNRNTITVQKQINFLLKKNIKILFYFGELDIIVPYISRQWFIDDLNVTSVGNVTDWFYKNKLAATLQVYKEGLVFVKVKRAGHIVVRDKPAFSKHLFNQFLNELLFNVKN